MRVLIDECSPRFLKRLLVGHSAKTVQDCEWGGIKNGELLRLAEEQFDVFMTSDKNLRYQQNLTERKIAIVELPSGSRNFVKSLVSEILIQLSAIKPGGYVEIKK